jgi:heterodisulfide reductase subunit B
MYSDQQKVINAQFGKQYDVPVLLYPQLLGMALGGDPKNDLGLGLNTISLDNLLAKAGINKEI